MLLQAALLDGSSSDFGFFGGANKDVTTCFSRDFVKSISGRALLLLDFFDAVSRLPDISAFVSDPALGTMVLVNNTTQKNILRKWLSQRKVICYL
jgi:hypothetical protein